MDARQELCLWTLCEWIDLLSSGPNGYLPRVLSYFMWRCGVVQFHSRNLTASSPFLPHQAIPKQSAFSPGEWIGQPGRSLSKPFAYSRPYKQRHMATRPLRQRPSFFFCNSFLEKQDSSSSADREGSCGRFQAPWGAPDHDSLGKSQRHRTWCIRT